MPRRVRIADAFRSRSNSSFRESHAAGAPGRTPFSGKKRRWPAPLWAPWRALLPPPAAPTPVPASAGGSSGGASRKAKARRNSAASALRSLLKEERWTRGEAKEVQAQASLVLRRYLEQQFGLKAAERTTSEIQAMLGASSVPMDWHQRLVRALKQADAVKFAKGDLPHLTHKATLESYIKFVEHTSNADVEPSSPRHDV